MPSESFSHAQTLLTFVFAPQSIRWGKVVYSSKVLELVHWGLTTRDPEFMLQFPRCCDADTKLVLFYLFRLKIIEGVGTAGVRPHVRERDLLARALLKEEFPI